MPNRVMAHMVACFPDTYSSMHVALALINGGCSLLEVQFPFSDPTADGKYIQKACDAAISAGFTPDIGFSLIGEIRNHTDIPILIMGYANTVVSIGVESFLAHARSAGATGIIIPDLPPDYDEGLYSSAGTTIIPVPIICPTTSDERLERIFSLEPVYVYAVLRKGITCVFCKGSLRAARRYSQDSVYQQESRSICSPGTSTLLWSGRHLYAK
jgi:tryptophan synthase alpha chain